MQVDLQVNSWRALQQTGPPTVQIWKINVSTKLAAKENLAKQEKTSQRIGPTGTT